MPNNTQNKSVEEILEEFNNLVIGDTFAGGTFTDNDNQKMYTAGFKDGVQSCKGRIRDGLRTTLTTYTNQIRKEAVEEERERIKIVIEQAKPSGENHGEETNCTFQCHLAGEMTMAQCILQTLTNPNNSK